MSYITPNAIFHNEPFTDFTIAEERDDFLQALSNVKSKLGAHYPLLIGGESIYTEQRELVSLNPAEPEQVIGYVSKAGQEFAEHAMQNALSAFTLWSAVPAEQRAVVLLKAASLLRIRKHEFSAWLVYESGKNWAEADADTAEAIDFMEYYAREMIRLSETSVHQPLTSISGEDNKLKYIPLGVGVIIPPWNFPLAILAGMTSAAVVCGNTVVLKPASTTPVIAYQFCKLMKEAGVPNGVINYVPGSGAEIGDYLTLHPKTRFICFTGSKEVGLRINQLAAQTENGQIWIKRVIAEMGGKDGIVVDETADLPAAAVAIVNSAFGFQGQKCSAASRAIIVESVYDEVVSRIIELTRQLKVGLPEQNASVGPVIDENSFEQILEYIEIGKEEGKLVIGGEKVEGSGYMIQPAVFIDVDPKSRLMQEEIFGPVLAVTPARNWEEAIRVYNDTEFGLTGSFFSTNEVRIQEALNRMHCGNLYVNRKCTGALVGAHPFGGFNMSGTDSKAGGHDYLLLFTQAKLVSRKI
ncbi:L-glutamate gamma-semialdehyde dehydrogenase [Paenibacillus pini]|uniref:L-glutamate gamma-semialdehyde dehydrogenase n=1 Tax=Paenibacillus pini JCM 16418 TaxID=1236976 RepID=W7Z7K8_9BACL|nr:L-glutamate gamma-semialdehyde dehydrogenase [Paenibacillus pini]GAF10374.1 delta-1-pyrroline-5-carboxylate dehydrogenase [Paenibacillus pini JCM 16418]